MDPETKAFLKSLSENMAGIRNDVRQDLRDVRTEVRDLGKEVKEVREIVQGTKVKVATLEVDVLSLKDQHTKITGDIDIVADKFDNEISELQTFRAEQNNRWKLINWVMGGLTTAAGILAAFFGLK